MRIARWWYKLPLRLRSLLRRRDVERELDEELRGHIEQQTALNIAAGMSSAAARCAALREFGGIEFRKEEVRDTRGVSSVDHIAQDVRYAARILRKSPGFTAIAVLTLALGIGANAAIFAVVQSVLLRPRPYPHPDRLVRVFETDARGNMLGLSKLDLQDWEAQSTGIAHFAAFLPITVRIGHDARTQGTRAAMASTDFFDLFGVAPIRGTGLTTLDGGIVIGESLWRNRFGGTADIVGKTIIVDDTARVISGVMPASFAFPNGAQLWLPQDMVPRVKTARTIRFWPTVAELKPNVTIAGAQAELSAIAARLAVAYPNMNQGVDARVMDLEESITGKIKPTLILLTVMAGLVLLVACTNLANLMLARAVSRRRELAVRAALGATRHRIARQLLTESLLLAIAGAALALPVAFWSSKLLRSTSTIASLPIPTHTSVGWVFVFSVVMALATAIVFGTAPAVRAARVDVLTNLKAGGGRGATAVGMSGALVIGEVALATLLLVGAALTGRSLMRLEGESLGYDPKQLVFLSPTLTRNARARLAVSMEMLEQVRALPGIVSAAILDSPPLRGDFADVTTIIDGDAGGDHAAWHLSRLKYVSEGYFRTLGVPFKSGRDFLPTDDKSARAMLINETMAKEYWPGRDPLGSRVALPEIDSTSWALHALGQETWFTVIGVVGDTRDIGLGVPPQPAVYLSVYYEPFYAEGIVARSSVSLKTIRRPLLDVAAAATGGAPASTGDMNEFVAQSVATPWLRTFIALAFASLALILAAMGVYGVAAHVIARRTAEIGIRMALGARPWQAFRAVTAGVLACSTAGLAIGVVIALASVKLIQSFLYGISTRDLTSFVAAVAAITVVALIAMWVPARRATRIDPTEALRAE